jgi:hypothetical protein
VVAGTDRELKESLAVEGTLPEPAIGHLKSDHRMDRCWLQGELGDALHAVLCAAGYNLRWLMRAMVRLGRKALLLRPNFLLLIAAVGAVAAMAASHSRFILAPHSGYRNGLRLQ